MIEVVKAIVWRLAREIEREREGGREKERRVDRHKNKVILFFDKHLQHHNTKCQEHFY